MKVYFNSGLNKVDNSRATSCNVTRNNHQATNTISTTDLRKMPNYKYQVSFGAMNSNLDTLYKAFGQGKGMPETYNKVLSEMPSSTRKNITSVYAHYRGVYAPLEECHSTEEIKKLFPTEFAKIQSALTRKSNNGSFISKVSQWGGLFQDEKDKFLFPETKDNDLAVYLAKKLFLEAKTKSEVKADFFKDINKEILSEKDIQELTTTNQGTEAIPDSVFVQLGLQGKFEANGFRNSLMRSREDFIQKYGSVYHSKRKAAFEKTVEAVISNNGSQEVTLPQRGSASYEKSQYAMFDVWNNSMDLRVAMSEFLTGKKVADEMLMPDLLSIHTLKIRKDETQMQKQLMQEFWAKNPTLKCEFSNRCKDSFDRVEKAIDEGRFEELKKEIATKRQSSFVEMKAIKEERERKILEQKRIAEEQIRIENLNNAIKNSIKNEVIDMRKNIAIPQGEILHTAQYLSKPIKDGKGPDQITAALLYMGVKTVADVAAEKSFVEICRQKGIHRNIEPQLKDMFKEVREKGCGNFPKSFTEQLLYDKCHSVTNVLMEAHKKYLVFVCNNSSNSPKFKVRRKEMENIVNTLLQDSNVCEKLELDSQKKLLKVQAIKIAEIPPQEVERFYAGNYHKALNKLSEIKMP